MSNLRQTDYLVTMDNGNLYVLLVTPVKEEAAIVMERFSQAGYQSKIVKVTGG